VHWLTPVTIGVGGTTVPGAGPDMVMTGWWGGGGQGLSKASQMNATTAKTATQNHVEGRRRCIRFTLSAISFDTTVTTTFVSISNIIDIVGLSFERNIQAPL
jgi:hypothetical protein